MYKHSLIFLARFICAHDGIDLLDVANVDILKAIEDAILGDIGKYTRNT
jgi:hypothetical protein